MSQYDALLRQLADSRAGYDQSQVGLLDAENTLRDASTQRFHRGLFGLGEAIYDAYRRGGAQKQYNSQLEAAMASARGVDDRQRELDQFIAQQEAMNEWLRTQEERAYKEKVGSTKFDREKELQAQKDAAAKERAALRNQGAGRSNLSFTDIPSDGGGTQRVAIDPQTGDVVRSYGTKPPKPDASAQADAGKDADIQEALGILDSAEALLNESTPVSGTGPAQGRLLGWTPWGQNFEAKAEHLFAVAKRIYKTKGEGQFSDADARALRGMLFSLTRYEPVNKAIIDSLRQSLTSRSPSFRQFQQSVQQVATTEPSDDDEFEAALSQYK